MPLFVSLIPICSNAKLVSFTTWKQLTFHSAEAHNQVENIPKDTVVPFSTKFPGLVALKTSVVNTFSHNRKFLGSIAHEQMFKVPRESAIKGTNCSSSKSFFADL
ncbi:hypothetical protein CMV_020960 [Castanea mollissima]|uniref:Uncharacterized protein n=1 Tax=Castanea mollissima TaxID=60419 RepID=A0A8J4QVQ8_9ROSI|nr:hypothetical protein CMV_020960 [Castanea mollissima]